MLKAKPDSPVAVLTQGKKRVTAFIPTDAAFRRLVTDLTGNTPRTERATFTRLSRRSRTSTPSRRSCSTTWSRAPRSPPRQAAKADGAKLKTAQGGVIKVDVKKHGIRLIDRDPDARNPRLVARALDINKGNRQIAHGISQVLRPSNL